MDTVVVLAVLVTAACVSGQALQCSVRDNHLIDGFDGGSRLVYFPCTTQLANVKMQKYMASRVKLCCNVDVVGLGKTFQPNVGVKVTLVIAPYEGSSYGRIIFTFIAAGGPFRLVEPHPYYLSDVKIFRNGPELIIKWKSHDDGEIVSTYDPSTGMAELKVQIFDVVVTFRPPARSSPLPSGITIEAPGDAEAGWWGNNDCLCGSPGDPTAKRDKKQIGSTDKLLSAIGSMVKVAKSVLSQKPAKKSKKKGAAKSGYDSRGVAKCQEPAVDVERCGLKRMTKAFQFCGRLMAARRRSKVKCMAKKSFRLQPELKNQFFQICLRGYCGEDPHLCDKDVKLETSDPACERRFKLFLRAKVPDVCK